MKISGFTMVRNATLFYFPIKEAIASILPIVDEFVVALGKGDPDDTTENEILSLNSPKIKIIHRVWDETKFIDGMIFRDETNIALENCSGDWCFYLQADEVVHEKDLPVIVKACKENLNNKNVDGLLFSYYHFWGDYQHFLPFHGWYRNEIRIIRNHAGILSYKDAQSFRKDNNYLRVKPINAHIYHYGWVRPPDRMIKKKKEQDSIHWGKEKADLAYKNTIEYFDYGPMNKIPLFKQSHPQVMEEKIKQFYWKEWLKYNTNYKPNRKRFKHEQIKYRIISWFENKILAGKQLFGYKNWIKL